MTPKWAKDDPRKFGSGLAPLQTVHVNKLDSQSAFVVKALKTFSCMFETQLL